MKCNCPINKKTCNGLRKMTDKEKAVLKNIMMLNHMVNQKR